MTLIKIIILLFLIHIKYGNNIQDIPNVSYTSISTYVMERLVFFFGNSRKIICFSALPLSIKTNQYLREQLVNLNEQFSSLKLLSTDRIMREIYMKSLNTFIIEKRNLTELVHEMANYTNGAIMKKLIAIRNLVNISEQSYRRFAETDETIRNATAQFMEVSF
jgi:hypothetical protein